MAVTTTNRIIGGNYGMVTVNISTVAEVRALFSAPVNVISPPSGKAIELVSWSTTTTNTAAFATNTNLVLKSATAGIEQGIDAAILLSTAARTLKGSLVPVTAFGATATQIVISQPLILTLLTGDATAGNAGITIDVFYRIV